MPIIRFPSLLKPFVNQQETLIVQGTIFLSILEELVRLYPDLKPYFFDNKNQLCSFINFYVNDQDIRLLSGAKTHIEENDIITIVPAIAGG